ncbi:MAG: hypothetical protein J6386_03470 [Candidatus Synoicihabitans palmerolidicus]|nr:hypothetical protein [Candidatus Synoicihabitans palmerolidicus]
MFAFVVEDDANTAVVPAGFNLRALEILQADNVESAVETDAGRDEAEDGGGLGGGSELLEGEVALSLINEYDVGELSDRKLKGLVEFFRSVDCGQEGGAEVTEGGESFGDAGHGAGAAVATTHGE